MREKITTAAICVMAVVLGVALLVNSSIQVKEKTSREAYTWKMSWASRK